MTSSRLSSAEILREAEQVPSREDLAEHSETIAVLRRKKYTWRQIAQFLVERGVDADHTKVFRFMKRKGDFPMEAATLQVPSAEQYKDALVAIEAEITPKQLQMLEHHYRAHNRTTTFTQLAQAAGFDNYRAANLAYGTLGKLLGDKLGMKFAPNDQNGEDFFSSAIGSGSPYRNEKSGDFQLIMHHELAKALNELGWFSK